MGIRLILPQKRFFNSYFEALIEHRDASTNKTHWQKEIQEFPANIRFQRNCEIKTVFENRTYWAIEGEKYLGMVQIKLRPTARHASIRNNLYYDIRPKMRGKGYGTIVFGLALRKSKQLGLKKMIITCDETNGKSISIITKNKARFVRKIQVPGESCQTNQYEISLASFR